ncbi:hypothetical protein [Microtetraspora sp. AC03309]|uniref:hypothetical protein n=1 Tax=Microtetraspora sp. AC03309 TaxID=2779376 RepID=UPI001E3B42FE|nr:hypothetical protein [Microtetraspora sp. AC03309]
MSDEWRPRSWRMPDGGTLVEGPAFPLRPAGPDLRGSEGESLTEERTYYRLDPEGRLERSFEATDWSLEYEQGVQTYHVEGSALLRLYATHDCYSDERVHRADVEREGLVPLPPEEAPSAGQVRVLAAENRERMRAEGLRTRHPDWPDGGCR